MNSTKDAIRTIPNVINFIGVILILYVLKPLIMPLLLAAIFGVMIFPVQKFFERKLKFNRLFATICSIVIVFSLTIALIFIIASQLQIFMDNGDSYINKITEVYTKLMAVLVESFNINTRTLSFSDDMNLGELLRGNFDKVFTFIFESGTLFTDLVLIPIYLFFFLYYRRFLRNFAYRLFNKQSKSFVNMIIKRIYNIQQSYLLGLTKVIIIVGILNSIGLLILGIENALFFGFFAAILLVIPYVGVLIGSLLPALVALATKDSYWYAFGVIAVFGIIQFIEGYFITPKVTGSNVSINSFVAIVALIAFAMLWGISGMVVALPVTASLKIIFDNSPKYSAYGFLIGEPEDQFLRSKARARLKNWKFRRKLNSRN